MPCGRMLKRHLTPIKKTHLQNQMAACGACSRSKQLLGLDWQYGAAYFEETLIDFDPASNWGNWQYLAGVGSDPRGCRQFNLNKQTQTYDPHGELIEYWADYAPSN